MKTENIFFEKPLATHHVNVSICKCNIKSKPNTYYGRVCKNGKVGSDELLSHLKALAPYLDINMMKAGLEKLVDIIADLVANGNDVDFFNLGTFSLNCEGAIEVNPAMQSYVADGISETENADFDISNAITKEPTFSLKFEASSSCKKICENVKMALAIKKRRAPVIEKIENVETDVANSALHILRITGQNLKIAGDKEEIGVYIKEENGKEFKISRENILQNTPKMLMMLLNSKLKNITSYTLSVITQYAAMGSTSTTCALRKGAKDFIYTQRHNTCEKTENKDMQDDKQKKDTIQTAREAKSEFIDERQAKKEVRQMRRGSQVFAKKNKDVLMVA